MGATQLESRPAPSTRRTRLTQVLAARLWDDHGLAAFAMARVLLDDEAAADLAVVGGMTDYVRSHGASTGAETRRLMAGHIYARCTALAGESRIATGLPSTMSWVADLARLQRACLALCVFGGHTYREAAELLDLPPQTVAEMLTSVLEEIAARPSLPRVSIAAAP